VVELQGREKTLMISLSVSIQYRRVTDGQTPGDSKDRAYAKRRGVKEMKTVEKSKFDPV